VTHSSTTHTYCIAVLPLKMVMLTTHSVTWYVCLPYLYEDQRRYLGWNP